MFEQAITQGGEVFCAEDVCRQLVQDGLLERFFGDPGRLAFVAVALFFEGAGVIAVGVILRAAMDGFSSEGRATDPAAQKTGEDVITGFGTRMVADGFRIFSILFEGIFIDHLDLLPGGSVYDRLAVIINNGVPVAHYADVDLIGKKMVP